MNGYETIINSIKRGMIAPVYLFYGTELYLRDKAVAALKEYFTGGDSGQLNLTTVNAGQVSLQEVIDAANTLPFFSEHRLIIVENAPYFKNKRKKNESAPETHDEGDACLLEYLAAPNQASCLLFIADEGINKQKKVFKQLGKVGQALEFAPVYSRDLNDWARSQFRRRGKTIEAGALNYLLSINSNDLGILAGEIEKLTLFDLETDSVTMEDVKLAATASVEAGVFNFIDAVCEKNSGKAIEALREVLAHGEPAVKVLILLARQVRLLLATKSLGPEAGNQMQLAGKLGVAPYTAKKLLAQVRNYSKAELEQGLSTCLETDLALKSSRGAPGILLELAVLCICHNQPLDLLA